MLDVDVNDGVHVNNERQQFEHNSGISIPVIRKEYWERALGQAQQDHERQQRIQRDVHGENQNTHEQIKVKVPPKPYEPTKEERQSHEATQCPFRAWCEVCVKAKSPDGKHTKQLGNAEHIPVIEVEYAFATNTLVIPTGKFRWWLRQIQFMGQISPLWHGDRVDRMIM